MSRSRRHTPIAGMCGDGAGPYRQIRAGKERARLRGLLATGRAEDADVELAPWDEWQTSRDGKLWVGGRKNGDVRVHPTNDHPLRK